MSFVEFVSFKRIMNASYLLNVHALGLPKLDRRSGVFSFFFFHSKSFNLKIFLLIVNSSQAKAITFLVLPVYSWALNRPGT